MLLPDDLAATIPPLYAQETAPDAIARARLTCGTWTWYVTELDPATGECFGFVIGLDAELGYFDLGELEASGAEVDAGFTPTPLSKIRSALF